LKGIAERISGGLSAGAGLLRAALSLRKQAHDGDVGAGCLRS
jgi:hypothetical protein